MQHADNNYRQINPDRLLEVVLREQGYLSRHPSSPQSVSPISTLSVNVEADHQD